MSKHDCSGFIGVSGTLQGSIVVSLDQDVSPRGQLTVEIGVRGLT